MKEEISFWEAIRIMQSRACKVTCRCVFENPHFKEEYSYQIHDNELMYFDNDKEKYIPSSLTIQDALKGKWYKQ